MALISTKELIDHILSIGDLRRLNTKTIGEAISKCRQYERVIPERWIQKEIETTSHLSGEATYSEALRLLLMNWDEENEPFDPRKWGDKYR